MDGKMQQIREKILNKKNLYILCFLALNLIEFLRATQTGDIWHVAVNFMGIVFMLIVVSAYPLKIFLNPLNAVYTLLCLASMVAVYFHWRAHYGEYLVWQIETAIVNVWWIGILARLLFRQIFVEKIKNIHLDKKGWIWIVMSFFMIASVSGRWWPLWYLLMFGSFYLTRYTKEDAKALWDAMIDGTILSFFCLQIFAYGTRPYDTVRYVGFLTNSNMMGLYYLIIYLMALYKQHILHVKKAAWGWKLFYFIGAGGLLSFQLFTMCRTAWVTSIVITILYGILVVRKLWKLKWGQVLLRGMALCLMFMATFLPVYLTIRWLPTLTHYRIWFEGEYSVSKVHSFDPPDSEKYIDLDEFLDALLGRIINTVQSMDERNPFVLQVSAIEMERVELVEVPWTKDGGISQRLTIYKAYLRDMTWYGNPENTGYYLIGDGEYHSWHAQNLWIQIGYYFGIPAGILSIVLTVVLIYSHGKKMLWNKEDVHAVIPFFMCILYFVFGIMEVVWNPGQLVMFLMFFVQHPQCGSRIAATAAEEGDGNQ